MIILEKFGIPNTSSLKVTSQIKDVNIISKSGGSTGDYDFSFEWLIKSMTLQLLMLIDNIDEALKLVSLRYTVTTKNWRF